jgi:hypothetical protein
VKRYSVLIIGLAVLALGVAWFFATHERVETQVWVGPTGAARENPYLAAMRFAETTGATTSLVDKPTTLDKLAEEARPATVILQAGRAVVTAERAKSLLRWADAGAHLIIEPEPAGTRDALVDQLGVQRRAVNPQKVASTMLVDIPDLERPIVVSAIGLTALDAATIGPDLVITDPEGVRIVSARRGAGRVTIVTGVQRFRNNVIGTHDNAEFLRALIEMKPTIKVLHVFRPMREKALWAWIKAHALAPLVVTIACLALWLWHVSPRFGPPRPVTFAERRQLTEHVRACGRFRWANGAREALLAAARERSMRQLKSRHPRLALAGVNMRHQALAYMLGTNLAAVQHAFEASPARSRDFIQTIALLAKLNACLERPDTRTRPRVRP